MLFLTHFLFGILIALLTRSVLSGGNYLIFFLLVLFGSIFPDIDERKSKIVNWSGIAGRIISFFSHHRGFFHSLFFTLLITLLVKLFFNSYYAWGIGLGLTSHLILDSLTKQGIHWFYPFPGFKLRGWFKTGGIIEWGLRIILILLILVVLI